MVRELETKAAKINNKLIHQSLKKLIDLLKKLIKNFKLKTSLMSLICAFPVDCKLQ